MARVQPELLFVESGGDNLAAQFSRELADYTIYVIDVAGGDKVPRKGGPGITQSDLLVINKTDLAPHVGADLGVMERDARKMRGDGPFVFAQVTHGIGIPEIVRPHPGGASSGTVPCAVPGCRGDEARPSAYVAAASARGITPRVASRLEVFAKALLVGPVHLVDVPVLVDAGRETPRIGAPRQLPGERIAR